VSDHTAAEALFADHAFALSVYRRTAAIVESLGPAEVRVTPTQVAFRRRRGFAYLWLPGRWLKKPVAEVVLSIALGRAHPSKRFKQVVHPSRRVWMHHLEVHALTDIDEEVESWLREAYEDARQAVALRNP
jgi:hypothetical protein